jgi:excinuclease ABC subunit C
MNNLKEKLQNIPTSSGCYLYKNKAGQIIYVGKAKDLKKRVLSYFNKKDHDGKTEKLVSEVFDLEYIVTKTEVEALLLEARLIRENKPKYNIDLKNSIRYAYLKLTTEKFPRLLSVRKTDNKGKFFGPYTDGSARARIMLLAVKMFKIRTCTKMPKKACLQYYIGNCQAPCEKFISENDYQKNIKQAEMFLKGDIKKLVHEVESRIKEFSNKENYEQAIIYRDQLKAIEILQDRQKVDLYKKTDQDIINFIQVGDVLRLQLFHIKKGAVLNKEEFELNIVGAQDFEPLPTDLKRCPTPLKGVGHPPLLTDFVKQYYATSDIPHEIILPEKLLEQDLIKKYLAKLAKRKVEIIIPKQGIRKELLEMVKENLILSLENKNQPLVDLRDKLNLAVLPRIIECFDVSNLGATNIVGSMVRFVDGLADKNNYRKFKIKSKDSQDDFASMAEIVGRRYGRMIGGGAIKGSASNLEAEPLGINAELPDLIMVDGGLGQLHSAFEELKSLNLSIPIIGLAKKEELIYTLGTTRPIRLSDKTPALKLLQKIRDEAHRFVIGFQRSKRKIII